MLILINQLISKQIGRNPLTQLLFLTSKQQVQSTEGNNQLISSTYKFMPVKWMLVVEVIFEINT